MGDRFSSFAILHSPFPHAALGRRTSVVRTGTAFAGTVGDHLDLYGYNDRNELTGATTYQGADLANPGAEIVDRRRGYAYDPIGNRQTATNGTEAAVHYCANNLNQYTATGGAAGCSTASETFTYDDDGNMTKDGLRVLDEYNQPILDTERSFYWDTENRLWLAAPKHPQAGSIGWWYKYDQLGRRVRKYSTLWDPTLNSGQGDWQTVPIWPPVEDYRYVYDGWNLVLELDATSWGGAGVPPVKRRYTWGLDLAGQSGAPSRGALDPSRDREGAGLGLHAAGGIGGLLAVEDHSGGTGVPPVSRLYFYDANGNVGQLVDSTDGTVVAKYECDPYGNALLDPANSSESGPYAASNPFRFSTKYVDPETGFSYFGHRYLAPSIGRWMTRDPLHEKTFHTRQVSEYDLASLEHIGDPQTLSPEYNDALLYVYVHNSPAESIDPIGLRMVLKREPGGSLGGPCGKYRAGWRVVFGRTTRAPCDGYVVQQVGVRARCYQCSQTTPSLISPVAPDLEYWEAIPVKKGASFTHTDYAEWTGLPNAVGHTSQTGHLRFFCKSVTGDLYHSGSGWSSGHVGILPRCLNASWSSGDFVHVTRRPSWWDRHLVSMGQAQRYAGSIWDCCCGRQTHIAYAEPRVSR